MRQYTRKDTSPGFLKNSKKQRKVEWTPYGVLSEHGLELNFVLPLFGFLHQMAAAGTAAALVCLRCQQPIAPGPNGTKNHIDVGTFKFHRGEKVLVRFYVSHAPSLLARERRA
jgi:hypothetical protein